MEGSTPERSPAASLLAVPVATRRATLKPAIRSICGRQCGNVGTLLSRNRKCGNAGFLLRSIGAKANGPEEPIPTRPFKAVSLLVDGRGARLAHHLVLRAGGAGTADGADDAAVLDQRDAAARGDDVVERSDEFEVRLLHRVLEHLGRPAILHRDG